MSKISIAQSQKLKVLLELKGESIKGFGKPWYHPWVPFIVEFVVMMMVYGVQNTCNRLKLCFGYGGGGCMAILGYNPWESAKELWLR